MDGEPKQTITYTSPPEAGLAREEEQSSNQPETEQKLKAGSHEYSLEQLAFLRSGDKGDSSNIGMSSNLNVPYCCEGIIIIVSESILHVHTSVTVGVVARHPSYLPYLKQALTCEVVSEYFEHLLEEDSTVQRYLVHTCR